MHEVETPDGRMLRVGEAGAPDGAPVVVHHGSPASGRLYPPHAADAEARGIRLIGYNRPGYNGSTTHEGRTVADAAADVRAIAEHFGLDRIAVWGASGGGPHALACAALLPDLVVAAASIAGVAPIEAEGLDWTAGMGQDNLDEFAATRAGRRELEAYLGSLGPRLLEVDAAQLISLLDSLLAPVDKAALTGTLAEYFIAITRDALADGIDGWRDDDLAFAKPWGFDVELIGVPVLLRHGQHDRFVPISHGEWLARRIPGVEAQLPPDDGHLTLFEQIPAVHAWLLERF